MDEQNLADCPESQACGPDSLQEAEKALIAQLLRQASLDEGIDLRRFLQDFEKKLLTIALALCSGNRSRTCSLLRIRGSTLHEKLKRYRIRPMDLHRESERADRLIDLIWGIM